ncbi:hypothetical protein [Echinimonas agarilytica]|uniref:Uncharacterized protein n=1 Tax=Echinimonas agarilytica TaxID=1215918 RepID=A0AA41W986_9GAMM|nr:hypothetical protein [Echinimonas agarilytica]MCM2680927.1 hypothetical protein [Echinimonas agarilytica]
MEVCPECDGAGSLVLVGANGHQSYREAYTCSLCRGSGSVVSQQQVVFDYITDNLQEARAIQS